MKTVIKVFLAVFASLFVFVTTAYAAPNAAVLNSLSTTITCVTLAIVAMVVSNLRYLYDEDNKRLGDALIVLALFLACGALISLPTAILVLPDFAMILAALVIAIIAAGGACAATYSPNKKDQGHAVLVGIFYAAMCAVFIVIRFV